jgi:undecaprenol kinase
MLGDWIDRPPQLRLALAGGSAIDEREYGSKAGQNGFLAWCHVTCRSMYAHKNKPLAARFQFAFAGLAAAYRAERTFRVQIVVLVCVLVTLGVCHLEPVWWALVAVISALVLAAELFNTAIEHLADHLHPETHQQIGIVKDCAAAAVLVSACGAIAVGVAVTLHLLTR